MVRSRGGAVENAWLRQSEWLGGRGPSTPQLDWQASRVAALRMTLYVGRLAAAVVTLTVVTFTVVTFTVGALALNRGGGVEMADGYG